MLHTMVARQPLILADDLCEYSRNLLQNQKVDDNENDDGVLMNNEANADDNGGRSNP